MCPAPSNGEPASKPSPAEEGTAEERPVNEDSGAAASSEMGTEGHRSKGAVGLHSGTKRRSTRLRTRLSRGKPLFEGGADVDLEALFDAQIVEGVVDPGTMYMLPTVRDE